VRWQMTLKKILLTLKSIGLLYIVPITLAIIICIVGAVYAGSSDNPIPSLPICIVVALGFLLLLILPFALFYSRFYGKIDMELEYILGSTWVVTNNLIPDISPRRLLGVLDQCASRFREATLRNECLLGINVMDARQQLVGVIIIFVRSIDEKAYFQKWGIKYRKIAGLKIGNNALVVRDVGVGLEDTALEHELLHVIVDAYDRELRAAGKIHQIEDDLGLEHSR